jgi:hypothetical protein
MIKNLMCVGLGIATGTVFLVMQFSLREPTTLMGYATLSCISMIAIKLFTQELK